MITKIRSTDPSPISQAEESNAEVVEPIDDKPLVESNLSVNNWTTTISTLKLTAFARQLADNSAFIKYEAGKLYLSLASQHAHLATDKAKERLASALQLQLQQPFSIIIQQDDIIPHEAGQTLATQQMAQRSQKQLVAVDSIHNDPSVNALNEAFNARVIEGSIKPID